VRGGEDRARRVAWFVSPHGFGHAARAAATIEALAELVPELEVTIFTSVPRWFFEDSLRVPFRYRSAACDVGFAQRTPVEEDLPATLDRLEELFDPESPLRDGLLEELGALDPGVVVCDIAPLGLELARSAGIPSILIESFTWDWIYDGVVEREPRFEPWVARMSALFALASEHVQCEPVCAPAADAHRVAPIARRARMLAAEVREGLGIAPGRAMALVSMGGIEVRQSGAAKWPTTRGLQHVDFVVPGGSERFERDGALVLLPHRTPIFHPDLVQAADAVLGKLGYSTVAESVAAGTRFAFVPRPGFRETPVLAGYVRSRIPSLELPEQALDRADGLAGLAALLERTRPPARPAAGAAEAAAIVARALGDA